VHKLEVFQNKVPRRISGPKKERKTQEDKMDGKNSTHGKNEETYKILVRKPEKRR
jgi:hypothetical protein